MMEHYLHLKNYLDYFPGRLKYAKLGKSMHLAFCSSAITHWVYDFKINYLKDKMRHGMWVHILLKNLASFPMQHKYYFWHRRSKCYEKTVNFHLVIFEFKVFVQSNNKNNRFDLMVKYVWCMPLLCFFSFNC